MRTAVGISTAMRLAVAVAPVSAAFPGHAQAPAVDLGKVTLSVMK